MSIRRVYGERPADCIRADEPTTQIQTVQGTPPSAEYITDPDGSVRYAWKVPVPPRSQPEQHKGIMDSAKKVLLGAFAGAAIMGVVGGSILFSKTSGNSPRQPGITLAGNLAPKPGVTPTTARNPASKSTPTEPAKAPTAAPTSNPTQTVKLAPTATAPVSPTATSKPQPPAPQPPQAQWGETVDAQTYNSQGSTSDGNGGALPILAGDETNRFACEENGFDMLQNPPQGDGPLVRASDVQLQYGANSLPPCGSANISPSAPAMAIGDLTGVAYVWRVQ